jgi:hypothetical protein
MASSFGKRFRNATAFEKTIYVVLVLVLVVDVAVIVLARAEEDPPRGTTGERVGATTPPPAATTTQATEPDETTETQETTQPSQSETTTETETETQAESSGVPPCAEVRPPGPDDDAVRCRTRSAVLTIGGEDRPLLLGGTQVRVLSATLTGRTVGLRLRLRNETDAEQGVLAGGNELYLNLSGVRVDAGPVGDTRIESMEGATVTLRFPLTPPRLALLRRLGGSAELGVRPWEEDAATDGSVGVIRLRVALGA